MGSHAFSSSRAPFLRTIVVIAFAVLGLRVLLGILFEYRLYFPPNFDSAVFLIGRRESFTRLYATAFYIHIITGPLAILLGTFLIGSGGKQRWRTWHRWAGRLQMLLIFAALVPSGLVMAQSAFAGPLAGFGFTALSLSTALSAVFAIYCACTRRFAAHQQWATRLYLLLVSPLILRVVSGVLIVTQTDSETAYILNAWLSWLVPLVIYEAWLRISRE